MNKLVNGELIELTAEEQVAWLTDSSKVSFLAADNLTAMLEARKEQAISTLESSIITADFTPSQADVLNNLLTIVKGNI